MTTTCSLRHISLSMKWISQHYDVIVFEERAMHIMEFSPMAAASLCQAGDYGSRKFVTRNHMGRESKGFSQTPFHASKSMGIKVCQIRFLLTINYMVSIIASIKSWRSCYHVQVLLTSCGQISQGGSTSELASMDGELPQPLPSSKTC